MKTRHTALAAALVAAAVLSLPAAAEARPAVTCSGEATGVVVHGDLVVPPGASCHLTATTVTGSATVGDDANLLLDDSTVQGSLTADAGAFVGAGGSTVRGTARFTGSFGLDASGSHFRDGVVGRRPGFLYLTGTTMGSLSSTGGETYLGSARVEGRLRTGDDTYTDLSDTVVLGSFTVTTAARGVNLCGSEIDGPAVIGEAGGPVTIGGECGYVVFGDTLTVRGGEGATILTGNTVRGRLACRGNTFAPTGAANRLRGGADGQCADIAPEPTAAAPRLFTRSPALTGRRSAALAAAGAQGPAF